MNSERKVSHEERVWIAFAGNAIAGLCAINEMCDDADVQRHATRIADRMLEVWRLKFDKPAVEPGKEDVIQW